MKSSMWHKFAAFTLLACSWGLAGAQTSTKEMVAPDKLAGWDVIYQIEKNTASAAGSQVKGVIVKRFAADGNFSATSTATTTDATATGPQSYQGSYRFERKNSREAIERSVNPTANQGSHTIQYTFDTPTSGSWVEDLGAGAVLASGSFTIVPTELPSSAHLARRSIAGNHVALVIKKAESGLPANTYPRAGLVLQSYAADGTMKLQGFGPGTLNSKGTYTYTQVSEHFTLPYTMVYHYKTETSGTWFQNFGNGLILFSGTFDVFSD